MAKDPKRRGLGMGLSALFESSAPVDISDRGKNLQRPESNRNNSDKSAIKSESVEPVDRAEAGISGTDNKNAIIYVNINDIKPNANQPRKNFDDDKIDELADSIVEHGIIQPLIVRKAKIGYEIVAGERRFRAARRAKLKEIPCIVREFSDEENMLIAIIENMQREDLNPIEEAEGLNQMISTYGLTQEEVSKSIGKSRPYISNALRILNLPEDIRAMISDGSISSGHARAILSINGEEKQKALAERIVKEGLSVRAAEKLASGATPHKGRPAKRQKKDKEISYVEEELKAVLGTKVNIAGSGTSGAIEIEYYSREELERLIDILRSLR